MKFKIALSQFATKLGDINANFEKHTEVIQKAIKAHADLIIFPELALTGYFLQDLVSDVAINLSDNNPIINKLLDASKNIDIVTSFVEKDSRDQYFISAVYLSNQEILHVHRKVYLPTYGMFDEKRFFASGDEVRAFDTKLGRFGLLICEDFWHASPPYLLTQDGAELMIFISASPSRGLDSSPQFESARWVDHINQAYSSLFSCFIAHTNKVGFEDGINFWGGATIYGPNGELMIKAIEHEEALTTFKIDLGLLTQTRTAIPLLRDERPELLLNELNRILSKRNV